MANVTMSMERGKLSSKGGAAGVVEAERAKLRMKAVPAEMKARLKELDKRKQALAAKRGPWKDATPKQRAEAKAVAAEIGEVKAQMRAAADAQRQHELDKQAAAAKREAARKAQ